MAIRNGIAIVLLALLFVGAAQAQNACRGATHVLPEANGHGASILVPAGTTYPITVNGPILLEHWMHVLPSAPLNSIYVLWYLNDRSHGARRIGHDWNYSASPEPKNFGMSTYVASGEQFIVALHNTTGEDIWMYLAVTYKDC